MKTLLLLATPLVFGQTLVRPEQIHDWSQVSPQQLGGPKQGRVQLNQIKFPDSTVLFWQSFVEVNPKSFFIISNSPSLTLIICNCLDQSESIASDSGVFWFRN